MPSVRAGALYELLAAVSLASVTLHVSAQFSSAVALIVKSSSNPFSPSKTSFVFTFPGLEFPCGSFYFLLFLFFLQYLRISFKFVTNSLVLCSVVYNILFTTSTGI